VLECAFEARFGATMVAPAFETGPGITVLFGASGAGKTVTLKAVAGLIRPNAGRIAFDGTVLFDSAHGAWVPPEERRAGYVPQSLGIFPHLTVAENVAFGTPRGPDREGRVGSLLGLFGMAGFEHRKPRSLSGGQLQRVALARALARDTRLLLLDEPFSALDAALRQTMRTELLRLRSELGLTILFVTHDLREAHLLADRLAVFDEGRVLQFGARDEVFRRPANRRVAELTGVANILPGVVCGVGSGSVAIQADGMAFTAASSAAFAPGRRVDVAIRAERVILRRQHPSELQGGNLFEAEVVEELAFGSSHTVRLRPVAGGPIIEVELAARPYEVLDIPHRRRWTVEFLPEDLHVMPTSP
jgi:ABC-type Fe3+/spermidine/putrescine transport system ATPase subunit